MKSILLTTTAIVAFAGAAAADGHAGVSFSGNAALGYNDTDYFDSTTTATTVDTSDDNFGFYWDVDLDVAFTAALDNGLTAGAAFEIELVDNQGNAGAGTLGKSLSSADFVLSLESETAGMFFGDTAFAAETHWDSAGDMEADGFSEADGEVALRGDVSFGDVAASVSMVIANNAGRVVEEDTGDAYTQLSVGASGSLGNFGFAVAYQEENEYAGYFNGFDKNNAAATDGLGDNGDFNDSEIFGVSVGTSFSGADITLAYASNQTADTSSIGVEVAYPVGPVTVTGYYVAEDDATDEDNYGITVAYSDGPIAVTADWDYEQDNPDWTLEGSYDTGLGLTVLAGIGNENEGDENDYYVAGEYDLGGGASLLVSYAEDEDDSKGDEIGGPDYQKGTTVEVSFSF